MAADTVSRTEEVESLGSAVESRTAQIISLLARWERDLVEAVSGARSPLIVVMVMRPEVSRLILALGEGEDLEDVFDTAALRGLRALREEEEERTR